MITFRPGGVHRELRVAVLATRELADLQALDLADVARDLVPEVAVLMLAARPEVPVALRRVELRHVVLQVDRDRPVLAGLLDIVGAHRPQLVGLARPAHAAADQVALDDRDRAGIVRPRAPELDVAGHHRLLINPLERLDDPVEADRLRAARVRRQLEVEVARGDRRQLEAEVPVERGQPSPAGVRVPALRPARARANGRHYSPAIGASTEVGTRGPRFGSPAGRLNVTSGITMIEPTLKRLALTSS
jgi:hypothetical protein